MCFGINLRCAHSGRKLRTHTHKNTTILAVNVRRDLIKLLLIQFPNYVRFALHSYSLQILA